MSNNEIDDSKLKEDVKELFENKSTNIQNVSDIFDMEPKLNIKVEVSDNNIYQKLLESKKIAQITLNLYNETKIYKDLKVLTLADFKNPRKKKSSSDSCSGGQPEESGVNDDSSSVDEPKGSTVNDDSSSVNEPKGSKLEIVNLPDEKPIDDACSAGKPDESEVIDKLYRYVLYFLIAKYLEIFKTFKDIFGNDRLEKLQCSTCDTEFSFTECTCSGCEGSLLDVYEGEIDKHEESKISEIKSRKSCETNSDAIGDVPNGDDEHKGELDRELAEKHDGDRLDCNKWKCKHCEYANDDGNVNCTACMEARPEWTCKRCTVVNELSSEQCRTCGEPRENASNNAGNSEKDGTSESWTCWFGKCWSRNGGNEQFCTACGLDKSASRERGAAVDMQKYGGVQQVWICYDCGHINDLYRSVCGNCFEYKFDWKGGDKGDKMGIPRDKGDKMADDYVVIPSDKDDKMGIPRDKDDKMGIPRDKDDKMGIPRDKSDKMGIPRDKDDKMGIPRDKGDKMGIPRDKGDKMGIPRDKDDKMGIPRDKGDKMGIPRDKYDKMEIPSDKYDKMSIPSDKYDKMGIPRDKYDKMSIPRDKYDKMSIPRDKGDKMGIPRDKGANKWECIKCKSGNAREVLSCTNCHSPRMWACEQCTMHNPISDDNCGACGQVNENRITKYCLQCKHPEILCDNLCADCWKALNENWTCWYRFCGNRNPGNETYCKHCGLDRYAGKIKIGAPMMQWKGGVPVQIWICDRCDIINDISNICCQNYHCHGINKYRKQCYKCGYKYNYESSNYCEMCKERIY